MSGNLPTPSPQPGQSAPAASPCSAPQQAAASRCAEAERLLEVARTASEDLRLARRQRAELARAFDGDTRLGDRRVLTDAKAQALETYRAAYDHAREGDQLVAAAASWMSEVSRLNRTARRAVRGAAMFAQRQAEIDAVVDRLELSAEAARIAAASAREACLDARRSLAACEESKALAQQQPPPTASLEPVHAVDASTVPMASIGLARQDFNPSAGEPVFVALLRGDRRMLRHIVSRLSEEIGEDAGRLQLLMLDLRDAIIASGRNACTFDFPPRHPFWSQLSRSEGRAVAAALATLGRRFNGQDGWYSDQAATPREMAMAISLAGRDPRSIRRHPTPAELDTLWQGTTVAAAEFVFLNAPDLRLDALIGLLGQRADALAELWDNWGRLRPILLSSDATFS